MLEAHLATSLARVHADVGRIESKLVVVQDDVAEATSLVSQPDYLVRRKLSRINISSSGQGRSRVVPRYHDCGIRSEGGCSSNTLYKT